MILGEYVVCNHMIKRCPVQRLVHANVITLARFWGHIIPDYGSWPQLTSFRLRGVAIGGLEFLSLLTSQMPELRQLELEDIELTNWSWEGLFTGLRCCKSLHSLKLPSKPVQLRHRDGEMYPTAQDRLWGDYVDFTTDFRRAVERYVISGGRHPSLPANARDQDAEGYLEMFLSADKGRCNRERIARYMRAWRITDVGQIHPRECPLILTS